MKKTFLSLFFAILTTAAVNGQIVTFTLNGNNTDIEDGSQTIGLVTMTMSSNQGNLNSTSSNFGVDNPNLSNSALGEVGDQLDAGESLNFSFNTTISEISVTTTSFGSGSIGTLTTNNGGTYALQSGTTTLSNTLIASATSFTISSDASDTNAFGLSQIEITSVSAIPEPSTYAAMIGGLALVGVAYRRRKNQNKQA